MATEYKRLLGSSDPIGQQFGPYLWFWPGTAGRHVFLRREINMANILTSGEQTLQDENVRLQGVLDEMHDERHRLKDEVRFFWSALQDALAKVRDLQARVDHLTDEAKRWRAGE
jgi:hypothetical protein